MPRQIFLLYFQTLSGVLHKFTPFIPEAAPSLAPQSHIFIYPRGSSSLPFLSYPSNFQLSPRRSEKGQCKWSKGQSFYILHHSREIFLLLMLVHFCHLSCMSLIYFLWFKKDKNLPCSQGFSSLREELDHGLHNKIPYDTMLSYPPICVTLSFIRWASIATLKYFF